MLPNGEDKYAAILNFIQELYDTSFDEHLRSVVFDAVSLDHEAIKLYFGSFDDLYLVDHVFTEDEYLYPYHPYLTIIKDYFSKHSREVTENILKDNKVYSLHLSTFMSFVYGETFIRQQEVLRDEVYYEQKLFMEEIVRLLQYITLYEDVVIYLGDLHYSGDSTIELTRYIIESAQDLGILLVATFDTDLIDVEEEKMIHQEFVSAVDQQDMMVRIEVDYVDESGYVYRSQISEKEIFGYMETCFAFLAIKDCIHYGKNLYVKYNNRLESGDEKKFIDLLKILGKTHFIMKDREGALFYDNMAYSLAVSIDHKWDVCECKINLGYDYSINGQFGLARKHANDALKEAKELGYETLIYKAIFLGFIIDKESLYIESHTNEEDVNRLIEATKDREYYNYLSMIYTNPRELHDNYDAVKESRFSQGIELATHIGNDHQLGVAYHNQGIIYSQIGQIHLAYEYYQKSMVIKERIADKKRLSYIYNSMGYYYLLTEDYAKGHIEYLKSLNSSGDTADYHEVCMTLFNMVLNAFLCGKYTLVCDFVGKLIKMMKVARIQDIKYHSRKMIYDLYIISLVKCRNMSKAKDIYNKVRIWKIKPIENKKEEYFISEMMEFFMSHVDAVKEEHLVNAEKYVSEDEVSLFHLRKFYFVEKILYYKNLDSNYYKRLGKMILKEMDTDSMVTTEKVTTIINQKGMTLLSEPVDDFRNIDVDFDKILYTAKINQSLLKLRNRINEISFLNVVQNMLVTVDNISNMFIRLQQLIHGNTKVEKIYCRILKSKGYSKLNLENQKLVINEVYADRIFHYVADKSKPSILKGGNINFRTLKKVYGYSSIMYLPIYVGDKRRAELIFMTTDSFVKLNQDDLGIFTLVGRQVGESIERIENNRAMKAMNIKLSHLSRTDLLTNLYNRNALEDKLQEDKARIEKKEIDKLIILFIDLDNFKYYNDTFGHAIGDQILVYFSGFLKGVTKDEDFVARFGGDEFVVLLENQEEENAHQIAHEIYRKIKDFHYFERIIGQIMGKRVQIPKEFRLSCSIGMSSLEDDESHDVDDLLKAADYALYEAKREGKNRLKKAGSEEL